MGRKDLPQITLPPMPYADAPHWQSKWQVIETFAVQTGENAPPQFVPGGLDCARTVGVMCECSTPTRCIWKVRSRLDLENL